MRFSLDFERITIGCVSITYFVIVCVERFTQFNETHNRASQYLVNRSNVPPPSCLSYFLYCQRRTVILESSDSPIGSVPKARFYSYHCRDILSPLNKEMRIPSLRSFIPIVLTTPLCTKTLHDGRTIKPRMVNLGASRFSWITSPIVWTTMLLLKQYSM